MKKGTSTHIGLIVFLLFSFMPVSNADNLNPPEIKSVKLINPQPEYSSGDEITFEIEYSGGNPGLKLAYIDFDSILGPQCLSTDLLLWELGTEKYYSGLRRNGPVSSSVVRLNSMVTSDCIKGENSFKFKAQIIDQTNLYSTFSYSAQFPDTKANFILKLNSKDGISVPDGEPRSQNSNATINFNSFPRSVDLEPGKVAVLALPKKTEEGILIRYRNVGGDLGSCNMQSEYYGQPIFNLNITGAGICLISGSVTAPSGKIYEFERELKINLIGGRFSTTKDKFASTLEIKEKTIVCLKGKSSLKVIGKNPKCPAGYKKK